MAEQIKIAELNIDDKQLLSSLEKTKKSIDSLAAANQHLKMSGEANSQQFIKNEAQLKSLKGEYSSGLKVLQAVTKTTVDYNTALSKEVKTLDDAAKNNKQLKEVRNQVNASTKQGQKQLQEINKKIDKNNQLIKTNVSDLEKQKINIGNYSSALSGVNPKLGAFATMLGKGQAQLTNMIAGLKAKKAATIASTASTTGLSTALKVLKFALIATGIGAIVVVLGSLVGMLANTQKGTDLVSKTMAQLGAAFDVIVDRISAVGGAFAKFFSGDFEGGFNDLQAAMSGIGDEIAREAGEAGKLETALQELEKREIALIKTQAERKKSISELRIAAKDENKTLEERAKLLQDAIDLENAYINDEIKIAKERARISQAQIDLGESTRAEEKANAELQAAALVLETEGNKKKLALVTERESLLKREGAARDAAYKQELARQEKETADNEVKDQKELDRLQAFEDRKRELEEEAELRSIDDDLAREERKIQLELEAYERQLERDVENGTLLEEEKRALLMLETEKTADAIQLIKDTAAEDALTKAKENAEKEIAIDKKLLDAEKKSADARAKAGAALTGFLTGLLGDSIAAKIAAVAIDAAVQSALVGINTAQSLGQITASVGAANAGALAHPAAIASFGASAIPVIAANTAAGAAQSAAVTAAGASAIGGILSSAAIQAGGALIGGLASGKKVFARGGVLVGASHAHGGIKTPFGELEGGEAVINTASTSAFRPLLSAINEAGGGRKFADGGILGNATSPSPDIIDYTKIAEAMSNLPAPVVAVEEIQRVGSRAVSVEESSTF